jgi:hypothetical protein
VQAFNDYGESLISSTGNGAYYIRVPDIPVSLAEDITQRTATTDGLTWSNGLN